MTETTDPIAGLPRAARHLAGDSTTAAAYKDAAEALTAALPNLPDPDAWDSADREAFYRRLITQPAWGLHQLAHHVCHLAAAGVPDTARHLLAELGPTLTGLVGALDNLTPEAQCRTVLFVVTTRAFTNDLLPADTVSELHKGHFTRFSPVDLALPYSVMFTPQFFAQNQRDLIDRFLPQGHLDAVEDLSPAHMLVLSWLSSANIFSGSVRLAQVVQQADLSDDTQMAAVRSLAMRFGDPALKQQLGLTGVSVAPPRRTTPARLERMQKRSYQALNAGLNRAKTALPFLAPLQRKPKVGLCLSGQLRGYETALVTWRKTLFHLIEPQIFVHSWYDVGRSGAQPARAILPFEGVAFTKAYREIAVALGLETMQKRYPSLFRRLSEGARVTQGALAATYETPHVVLEDDKAPTFADFSNQHKMHYKIHAADALARQSGEFDLLMRIRPDLGLRDIGFSWRDLLDTARSGPVLFAEKGYGIHFGGLMIGDQCAIATPQTMQIYADTWTLFPDLVPLGFAKMPGQFTGHVSLAQTCWLNGLDVVRAPIRFGQLYEARKLSVAETIAALENDSTGAKDDLILLAAARSDL